MSMQIHSLFIHAHQRSDLKIDIDTLSKLYTSQVSISFKIRNQIEICKSGVEIIEIAFWIQ